MNIPATVSAFLLTALVWGAGFALQAQETPAQGFDFEKWQNTATRAEAIITDAQASSPALETLRATLSDFRSRALAAQDASQGRIDTIESQISALGDVPADGTAEAPEVATRRVELNTQLAEARAPVLAAQEAYNRADGLVGEIDRIIRERQTAKLFKRGVSPLNPGNWPDAIAAAAGFAGDIQGEISEGLASDAQFRQTRQQLPAALAFLVLGIVLLTRARRWLLVAAGLVSGTQGTPSQSRALALSTTQVIVPMLGIWAVLQALALTGLVGLRGGVVFDAVGWMSLYVFGALWLGRVVFTDDENTPVLVHLPESSIPSARRMTALMGVALALDELLGRMSLQADITTTTHDVLSFPIVLLAGYLLVRLGLILEPAQRALHGQNVENPLKSRIFRLIARAALVLGVAAPLLAAAGYATASSAFVFPAIQTLAVLGTAIILYRILTDLTEELVESGRERAKLPEQDTHLTLVPVVLGFALICLTLPLLALIWGARVSDLLEVWTMFSDGFSIGTRRVSVTDFLTFAIVFTLGYTATRLLQSTLRLSVLPRTTLDAGGRNAILSGTGYVGIFLAALAAITTAGFDLSSLAIVAGALSVGIGFGLQAIVSNFVSGIILLVERPIKEGDWIEVGSHSGYVRKISVRSTEIETFDRATVVVPNADFISGTVTNWTHSSMNGRVKVPVGVAYGSDPDRVREILTEIAEAHEMVDQRFSVSVVFHGFGADSLDFEIRAILKDVNWVLSAKSDMNFEIFRRFSKEGIEIPFAQRDINLRNPGEIGAAIGSAIREQT